MRFKRLITTFLILLSVVFLPSKSQARDIAIDQHIETSIRMIGHQILLNDGDSTSLVLPLEINGNRYTLSFDTEFGINPDRLAGIIDSVAKSTHFADAYMVEVIKCNSDQVAYSYQIQIAHEKSIVPCQLRSLPKACYTIRISVYDVELEFEQHKNLKQEKKAIGSEQSSTWILILLLFVLAIIIFAVVKRRKTKANPETITLGKYQFDKRNMTLTLKNLKIELSSKEVDLLALLYNSANSTLEREEILKEVWGDDGDYVGRTLDVFISKLRKKLENDPTIKIVNIRGVGYKLILNDQD